MKSMKILFIKTGSCQYNLQIKPGNLAAVHLGFCKFQLFIFRILKPGVSWLPF